MDIKMIFLDTSFIVSYYNVDDINHKNAQLIMNKISDGSYNKVCISDYVFDECATVLLNRIKNINEIVRIYEILKKIIVYKVDDNLFEDTWTLFSRQEKPNLSFTDCSIIALMKQNHINYLATFDDDFDSIEGIKILK